MASTSDVKKVFQRCDTDGSGYIERAELKRILSVVMQGKMSAAEIDALMDKADPGHDDRVSYGEFVEWVCASESGRFLVHEGEKLLRKSYGPPAAASGGVHVLIVEGSNHPGRLKMDEQFEGLPLHMDLLDHAFRQVRGARVKKAISPRKSEVLKLIADFAKSVPAGDLSILFFTGHGVQGGGEQFLVFASDYEEKTVAIGPLLDANSGEPLVWPGFRKRHRMQNVDVQIGEQVGYDWFRKGWRITAVDGLSTNDPNRVVAQRAVDNKPFVLTLGRKGRLVDFVSYDEIRSNFAHAGPSAHFVDACRVAHDDALGFDTGERNCDAASARRTFLQSHPVPANVATAFAVEPGKQAMHEGVGRNYDFGRMMLGHTMEREQLLESDYAQRIKEEWRAQDGSILQYHTSFFVEAFAHSLGELHLEGPTATVGELLGRMDACPFGRTRQHRGHAVFVGDDPALEGAASSTCTWRLQFQGAAFIPPHGADEL